MIPASSFVSSNMFIGTGTGLKLLCIWNVRGSWQIPTYFNSNCKRLIILLYCTMGCIFFSLDNSKTRASTQPPDNDFLTKHCSFLSHRAESLEVAPLTLDRGFNDLKNFAWSLWDTSKVSAWRSPNAMRPFISSHPSSDLWHPSPG